MTMSGFDKDVERTVKFWQSERNCVILLTDKEDHYRMDVLYRATGEIDKDIYIERNKDNKYVLIKSIRNYFKQLG